MAVTGVICLFFLVLSKFFIFMQLSFERQAHSLTLTFDVVAIFMGICIHGATGCIHTTPTPLTFPGHSLCYGASGCIEVRSAPSSDCWVMNTFWSWSLLLQTARYLFTAGLWQFMFFLLSFFPQLLWTWTILWLTWRPFKLSMRMWVIERILGVSIYNLYKSTCRCTHLGLLL